MTGLYTACAQSAVRDLANAADAYLDSSREKREQEAAQKDKADVDVVQKAKEKAAKEALSRLIGDMVAIPGRNFKMGRYEVTQVQW